MNAAPDRPRFEEFLDRDRYVELPARNIFDEHTEVYVEPVFDDDGKPVIDPETKKQKTRKVKWEFDKAELEKIAAVNNARNRAGDFSPIAIGHTNPRNPNEQDQPPIVGAGGRYEVAWDEPHQRWMLRANYYIRREDFDTAKTYPFTSIELHPSDLAIHPISLIRRVPKRDLGAWIFSRDGKSCRQLIHRFDKTTRRNVTVLRYMRELPDTEMNPMIDQPNEDTKPNEADHGEKVQQYMRDVFPHLHHITQHPFHGDMVKQYAMNAPGEDDDAAPVGEPNATPAEDAENQPPIQNAAFPSATNTGMPGGGKKEEEPMQHARTPAAAPAATPPSAPAAATAPNKSEPSQFARDIQAQQYSRLAEMFEGLVKEVRDLKSTIETKERDSAQALHFARCEQAVQDLVHKHNRIVEDPDGILARLKAVAPDKLQDEVLFFAKNLSHDIAGLSRDGGFVRTPAAPNNGFSAPEADEDPQTGQMSPRRAAQVLQYQRDKNLWDDPEKAKKECPKNYPLARAPLGDAPVARN